MKFILHFMSWFMISVLVIGSWICIYFFWVTLDKIDKVVKKVDKIETFFDKANRTVDILLQKYYGKNN